LSGRFGVTSHRFGDEYRKIGQARSAQTLYIAMMDGLKRAAELVAVV
jgi:hypothetical protein